MWYYMHFFTIVIVYDFARTSNFWMVVVRGSVSRYVLSLNYWDETSVHPTCFSWESILKVSSFSPSLFLKMCSWALSSFLSFYAFLYWKRRWHGFELQEVLFRSYCSYVITLKLFQHQLLILTLPSYSLRHLLIFSYYWRTTQSAQQDNRTININSNYSFL